MRSPMETAKHGVRPDPGDWTDMTMDHHQRGTSSQLSFFLFPLIAAASLVVAWFGWH